MRLCTLARSTEDESVKDFLLCSPTGSDKRLILYPGGPASRLAALIVFLVPSSRLRIEHEGAICKKNETLLFVQNSHYLTLRGKLPRVHRKITLFSSSTEIWRRANTTFK